VGAEGVFEVGKRALFESVDDGLVLDLLLFEPGIQAGAFSCMDAGDLDVGVQAFVEFSEPARAGDVEQGKVEMVVEFLVLAEIFGASDRLGESFEQTLEGLG